MLRTALEGFSETLHKEVDPAWNIKVRVSRVDVVRRLTSFRQVTIVEPGGFVTEIMSALQFAPQHPAYANSDSAVNIWRKFQEGPPDPARLRQLSDTAKGVQRIFDLTRLSDPPLRMPLGKDSVGFIRGYAAELTNMVEEYASWSNDLAYEGNGE